MEPGQNLWMSEGGAQVDWALTCLPLCLTWQMGVDIQRMMLALATQVQIPALPFLIPALVELHQVLVLPSVK